ncbi:MAG TPA: helix-turn-helix domain-containing protein [Kiritimatiellia bacterium]|jgi:DNA-binding transcriptional ArsR family regulator|nr:winged helix-turn-helix transcriptional regulator [Kiritimatiellia bacterium]HOR78358.1 helix-turn-helix domain-containing protein [Anaerolineaceae bacterium]HOU60012.1 helix-turn-helix domain-containing protein [Kiritimatiellia bacterium]HQF21113.1 helix-turn-helix domain-containing protein [Kiritimatiellia bacterium]HQG74054.1 helix-turn-helix domain-containing protein [Kiritimatiellia bacterium]
MILTPTLWRTSRVLANQLRLDLLRRIVTGNGPHVTELAEALEIPQPRASQELRRLQSRGLVKAVRQGRYLVYLPEPDPKVPSAKPILQAATKALAEWPDLETIRVAWAFGHQRRLDLVRVLQGGALPSDVASAKAGLSSVAGHRHLQVLQEGDIVQFRNESWRLVPNPHPLAKAFKILIAEK